MVCDIDFIVISENILRSVSDIPIVKPGISLYRRSLDRDSAGPIHFTITFAGQTIVDRYTGNIVILKIAKPCFSES